MFLTEFCHSWDVDHVELSSVPDTQVLLGMMEEVLGYVFGGHRVWWYDEDEDLGLRIRFWEVVWNVQVNFANLIIDCVVIKIKMLFRVHHLIGLHKSGADKKIQRSDQRRIKDQILGPGNLLKQIRKSILATFSQLVQPTRRLRLTHLLMMWFFDL